MEFDGKWNFVEYKPRSMSKRFYAACKAMQGMMNGVLEPNDNLVKTIVSDAYKLADEMLKQENE